VKELEGGVKIGVGQIKSIKKIRVSFPQFPSQGNGVFFLQFFCLADFL
jgi:hypothetical protein